MKYLFQARLRSKTPLMFTRVCIVHGKIKRKNSFVERNLTIIHQRVRSFSVRQNKLFFLDSYTNNSSRNSSFYTQFWKYWSSQCRLYKHCDTRHCITLMKRAQQLSLKNFLRDTELIFKKFQGMQFHGYTTFLPSFNQFVQILWSGKRAPPKLQILVCMSTYTVE